MTLALSVLAFGYLDIVARRLALKVPPADVDDLAHEVILSAIALRLPVSQSASFAPG